MPLRSKMIIFAVVMLLLFVGVAAGSYLSLSSAAAELARARESLEKVMLVETLQKSCREMGPVPEARACEQALQALANLERKDWRPESRVLLDEILAGAKYLKDGEPLVDHEGMKSAIVRLRSSLIQQVEEDLRRAHEPPRRRAFRLLLAAALIAVGGAATFAWLYSRLVRERRELEQRVRRSEKLAALGTLAGGLAHEINNPLAAISMAAEALANRMDGRIDAGTESGRFCAAIVEEANRCRNIISDLSDIARGGAVDRGPVDLSELFEESVKLVRRDASLPPADIRIHAPSDLPLLSADRGKVLQVIVNLLTNALKAGSSKVDVSASNLNGRMAIRVTDDGDGIPPELVNRIFEPFFTNRERGVGLGLTLCHRIAELHGGELRAESPGSGRGATFTLLLPSRPRDE